MGREHNVIITDLAGGDDMGAVLHIVASPQRKRHTSFVSTHGNRSSFICFQNLQAWVPKMNDHLKHPKENSHEIFYGADRRSGAKKRYTIESGGVELAIHADMGHDAHDRPYVTKSQRSSRLYQMLGNAPVHILSLGATSELPHALQSLRSNARSLVIMGGTLAHEGNTNPHQEANLRHDPKATQKTLELATQRKIPVVIIPLDATEQEGVLFTWDRLKFLNDRVKSRFAKDVIKSIAGRDSLYGRFYRTRTYHDEHFPYKERRYAGVPLHDLTAALIQEDFLDARSGFLYTRKDVHQNPQGEIGIARKYMRPSFPVSIVGSIKNYDEHWRRVVERMNEYR